MTIVIVGPHGVGKSAVGRSVAAALGVPFHVELGETLARARRGVTGTAADPQSAFDAELSELELAQDAASGSQLHRVVESWHPGNLAKRQHEAGPLDFFIRVGRQAPLWADRLGLHVLPAIATDGRSMTEITDRVVSQLQPFGVT